MAKQYGIVKIDQITFTTGTTGNEADATIDVSGLAAIADSGITVTGTISGVSGIFTSGLFGDGTATNPSITFIDDTNVGLYRPGDDELGFVASGAEGFRLEGSGKVLIGTTVSSGDQKLQVSGNALIDSVIVGHGGGGLSSNTVVGESAFTANTAGSGNIAIGTSGLKANDEGNFNVAIGPETLDANTSGNANIAIGNEALSNNVDGTQNIAIGVGALAFSTGVNGTIGIGDVALANNTAGAPNTVVGTSGLHANVSGQHNTALGYRALVSNTSGDRNIAIGSDSAYTGSNGDDNIAIGHQALYTNVNGDDNLAIGYRALYSITGGNGNVAIGHQALTTASGSTTNVNTAVGYQALSGTTTGTHNTAVGYASLRGNTIGSGNSAFGDSSLLGNTTGSGNVGIGFQALQQSSTGIYNVGVGYQSLYSNVENHNVGVGYKALYANQGDKSVAIGSQALNALLGGTNVIAIGHDAQASATTVSNEITLGDANITRFRIPGIQSSASSGDVLTYDSANGILSLQANTGGAESINELTDGYSDNSSVGLGSGCLSNDDGTANLNTAVGITALGNTTSGSSNTAVGKGAILNNVGGDFNTCIGADAGKNITGDGNTVIGTINADSGDSYVVRIGAGPFERIHVDSTGTVSGNAYRQSTNTLSATAFDPQYGGIQTKTITGNTNFTDSLADGESIVLHMIDGDGFTVGWPQGTTWLSSSGNYAPTLTDDDVLVFWKNNTTLFGAYAGSYQ